MHKVTVKTLPSGHTVSLNETDGFIEIVPCERTGEGATEYEWTWTASPTGRVTVVKPYAAFGGTKVAAVKTSSTGEMSTADTLFFVEMLNLAASIIADLNTAPIELI